ncbi:hypothetical protein BV898_15247 [Hypsibius exemplaris]|uniref:G-protein coupled receptors family 1 profile domain-containing protein n=1 Tax=Hypsibius exemplaris TaxID=2072580 RepID=A0A9X6NHG7_HYPEX|nr:hypothetical protein BV898_15247 [Hypsibius exemplaris]
MEFLRNYSRATGNSSALPSNGSAGWNEIERVSSIILIPVVSIVIYLIGGTFNGALLMTFARDRALRTPFNVYIINLLVGNLGIILFQLPFAIEKIVTALSDGPKWVYSAHVCNLILWGSLGMPACLSGCHELIALTRLWACLYPMHFRIYHTARRAVLLCVGMWVTVSLFLLPGIIVDGLKYRKLVNTQFCIPNVKAMPVFYGLAQFLFFLLPELVILVSLPIIGLVKLSRWREQQRRRHVIAPRSEHVTMGPSAGDSAEVVGPRPANDRSRDRPTNDQSRDQLAIGPATDRWSRDRPTNDQSRGQLAIGPATDRWSRDRPTNDQSRDQLAIGPATDRWSRNRPVVPRPASQRTNSFAVLVALTISVAICWTPNVVYTAMRVVGNAKQDVPATFLKAQLMLFTVEVVLDPILFALALRSLRDGLRGVLRGCIH